MTILRLLVTIFLMAAVAQANDHQKYVYDHTGTVSMVIAQPDASSTISTSRGPDITTTCYGENCYTGTGYMGAGEFFAQLDSKDTPIPQLILLSYGAKNHNPLDELFLTAFNAAKDKAFAAKTPIAIPIVTFKYRIEKNWHHPGYSRRVERQNPQDAFCVPYEVRDKAGNVKQTVDVCYPML